MMDRYGLLWTILKSHVSPTAKCVATVLLLKFYNEDTKRCDPSFGRIGSEIAKSRRVAMRACLELKEAGFALWDDNLGGSTKTNKFTFPTLNGDVSDTARFDNGVVHGQNGVVHGSPAVSDPTPEPSIEPTKNHEGEPRARATFLSEDFRPTTETYNWALDRLGSNQAVDQSIGRFVRHHLQSERKSRDWQLKLQSWIDDDAERKRNKPGSVIEAADRLRETIQKFSAGPELTERDWDGLLSNYAKTGRWTKHVDQCGEEPGTPSCKAPLALLVKHGLAKGKAA